MPQLRQNIILPPSDLCIISYSWSQAHIVARDILQDKPRILGLDIERDEYGDLHEIILATTTRVYRISLSGQRRGAVLDNALTAILSGQQRSIKLVAFDMAPIALCVADGARTTVRGVDLKATLGDLQMAVSAVFKRQMSSTKVNAFLLDDLWAMNNYSANASSLRAWVSVRVGEYCQQAITTSAWVVNTSYVLHEERTLLARLLREEFILRCVAPHEIQGEFTSHEFNKDGKLVLQNSRYKTRVRASQTTRVVVNYTNNESAYGRATKTHGRRSEIKLKHKGGGDRTIASISVIGAQARTNAERARDEFVLDVCCGRKPGLQSFAFIRHMFFPVAEELAGEAPESLRRREIYGLNLSQSEVVAGMVHSPRPCTVVHGPPGTGKTKTISAAVEVWAKHGKPTWAVAHSNVAVKNIAEGVARRGVDFRLIVSQDFYVEWHEALYELIEDKLIRSDEFPATTRELKMMMGDACVILSTVSMLSNPRLHQLRMFTDVMPVERLVIDEASQINVFEFMPLVAKFSKISKICFFGDPKQLPPYGKDDAPTIQCIFDLSHLNRYSHFLDTQYRMPIPLGNFISRYVYGGRLKSEHRIDDYSCIAFVDARKQSGEENLGRSKINRDEVQVMRNLVEHYHRNGKNFCVITPYDAQKAEIARDLQSVGLPSDRVFNVDSFQGNEADYVLVSMVRTEKAGFLKSLPRLNVLLTRCRRGMVIVTSPTFISGPGRELLLADLERTLPLCWVSWRDVAGGSAALPGFAPTRGRAARAASANVYSENFSYSSEGITITTSLGNKAFPELRRTTVDVVKPASTATKQQPAIKTWASFAQAARPTSQRKPTQASSPRPQRKEMQGPSAPLNPYAPAYQPRAWQCGLFPPKPSPAQWYSSQLPDDVPKASYSQPCSTPSTGSWRPSLSKASAPPATAHLESARVLRIVGGLSGCTDRPGRAWRR